MFLKQTFFILHGLSSTVPSIGDFGRRELIGHYPVDLKNEKYQMRRKPGTSTPREESRLLGVGCCTKCCRPRFLFDSAFPNRKFVFFLVWASIDAVSWAVISYLVGQFGLLHISIAESLVLLNPSRTPVPFWGQTTYQV